MDGFAYEGLQKNHSYTQLGKEKYETNADAHDKIALHSQTRGMHTSSAEYTTFITFELINKEWGQGHSHRCI